MSSTQDNATIINKVLTGAKWATLFRIVAQLISWVSTIVVVRFISREDYGLNAMLETPLELMFLLSTFGLDTALVRSQELARDQLRSIFGWLLIVNFTLFIVYFFGGQLLAHYFNEPRLVPLAEVLAFIFLLIPFRVIPNALMDRELKFKLKASAELVTSVITAAVTLTMAIMGFGIWALITGVITSRVLIAIILMLLEPWFITPSVNFQAARNMLAFGGTMALASAIAITANMLPVVIAGPRVGPDQLGIFVVALQFAILPLAKVMPIINPIIFPAFSKFQGQPVAIGHYMEKSLGVAALALLPLMIGLACVSEEFVSVVLGEHWSASTLPLAALCLAMPFRGATSFIRQVMGGVGYAGLSLKSTGIAWILLCIFLYIGANHGIAGMVVAIVSVEPIVFFATVIISKGAMQTSLVRIINTLSPAIISAIIMTTVVVTVKYAFSNQHRLAALIFEVAAGGMTYLTVLWLGFRQQFTQALQLLKR